MTRYAINFFRGHGHLGPPVYAYGYKKRMKYEEDQYLLDVQSSTDKKLVATQDR